MGLEQGYTTIGEILARLNSNPFIQGEDFDTNYATILISDALRMGMVREMYDFSCKIQSFDNYRIDYPLGFKHIIDIGYSNSVDCSVDNSEIKDIEQDLITKIGCKVKDECGNEVYQGWDYNKFMLEYNYLAANYSYKKLNSRTNETNGIFIPMQPSTSNLGPGYDRQDAVTYKLDHSQIRFNVKQGTIIMSYLTHPLDENGNFLIPNDIDVINMIESYYYYKLIGAKYYSSLEGDYYNRYRLSQDDFYSSLAAVKGKAKMPTFKEAVNIGRIKNASFVNRENIGEKNFFGYLPRMQQPNYNKWYN